MAKKNCLVCGKEFEACNSCSDTTAEALQWRRVVCCPEHFFYHEPIILYIRGKMSREEASNALRKAVEKYGEIDFVGAIQPIVTELLAEPKAKQKQQSDPVPETKPEQEKPVRPRNRRIRYGKTDE